MASRTATVAEVVVPEQFPVGLKVLVVDDHIPCLRIVEQMLRKCKYNVTTCSQATGALKLLRERKGWFDIVLSDVHMPDMDGFKLLELVGLEMDLPVIMMSADGRTNLVMRGIRHGACDYLIKPIREEELKNIWQHVIRKRWSGSKEHESSGGLEDNDRHKRRSDDAEYSSSVNEGEDRVLMVQERRKDATEEDEADLECDDAATAKKPRVVWSVELHQQFVSAVNQLGIDKAVPKRILELMNVPGLTRENVASHLQKFRLYLKRLSGVAQQQDCFPNSFCGPLEANRHLGSLGRFEIQALAAPGPIPPQTLAALQTELFNRSAGTLVLPMSEQSPLLQGPLQGSNCFSNQSMAYGQPLMKCQSNVSENFIQSTGPTEDITSRIGTWPSEALGNAVPSSKVTGLSAQSDSILLSMVQNEQQRPCKPKEQQENQYVLSEPSCSINVQPSCVVVPSNPSANFQAGSPASVNQNCSYSRSSAVEYGILSPQSHNCSAVAQVSPKEFKPLPSPSAFARTDSASPSMSCGSTSADNNAGWQVPKSAATVDAPRQFSGFVSNISYMQGSYNIKSGQLMDCGAVENIGIANRVTSIPSRFAVNEPGLELANLNHGMVCGENSGNRIKLEPNTVFAENPKVGIPALQHIPANDVNECFI